MDKKETLDSVMKQLEKLGNEQTKQTYLRHGAKEPLFGITTGNLKPFAKKIGKDYELSLALYQTGNYDAMYFAGMIADPTKMRKEDFEKWIQEAYCYGLASYVVSVTLAKSQLQQEIADEWIKSKKELYAAAGWSYYAWLLGHKADTVLEKDKLVVYLKEIENNIHLQSNYVRYSMNNFVIATGIFYLPLHKEALQVAKEIGKVEVDMGNTNCKVPVATMYIQKAIDKKQLGVKKNAPC